MYSNFFGSKAALATILILSFHVCSYSQDIESIKPLVSTRSDVEKILNSSSDDPYDLVAYQLKNAKLIVTYSMGRCLENDRSEWDVPKGVVTDFSYFPFEFERFQPESFLGYTRYSLDLRNRHDYVNRQIGKALTTTADDKNPSQEVIYSYAYFPREDQEEKRCKRITK